MQTWSWRLRLKHLGLQIFCAPLRDCEAVTLIHKAFLQGLPTCYSDFTADLRFRMRKVWRDIADMNPSGKQQQTGDLSILVCLSPLDLQADSRTRVRNGGALLLPPRYLHLDLPKHFMRNVSRFHLRAHNFAVEFFYLAQWKWPLWQVFLCCCSKWASFSKWFSPEVHHDVLFHC